MRTEFAMRRADTREIYATLEKQMVRYPEAFAGGTILYRRRENAKVVTYCMKFDDGRVMSGSYGFSATRNRGMSDERYLQYVYSMNENQPLEGGI